MPNFVGPTVVVVYPSCLKCLTAVMTATGAAAKYGILLKNGGLALENGSKQRRDCPRRQKIWIFWIFPHHSCENIQKYFEFLDTFGYSPIVSEPVSKI